MKIAILGGQGMLGQELLWRWQDTHEVFPLSRWNIDIQDSTQTIQEQLQKLNPEIVLHCAGYTHPDMAESHPEEAKILNSEGTKKVALACTSLDIPLIYLSTDYVFDGEKTTPYEEHEQKNPLSVYGKTKSEGEDFVKEICSKYYIVRTSWLYGKYGPNFVTKIQHLLRTKKEIPVVIDQVGTPTWTRDLADMILELLEKKYEWGIYHCVNTGETSWYDFACEIQKNTKKNLATLRPVSTNEYPQKAKRPAYSVLGNTKSPKGRDWRKSFYDFLGKDS